LRRVERDRRAGYVAAVLAAATVAERGHLELSDADWRRIRREFAMPRNRLPRLRVGDWIEAVASLVGITPERVQRVTRRPCGCRERKQWLNERAAAVAERLERFLGWILDPLTRGR
jgi:hypothetical protein